MASNHNVKKVFSDMKALFQKYGWVQGDEYREPQTIKSLMEDGFDRNGAMKELERLKSNPEEGPGYCLIGALKKVTENPTLRTCAGAVLSALTKEDFGGEFVEYNDSMGRTGEDIFKLLDDAEESVGAVI